MESQLFPSLYCPALFDDYAMHVSDVQQKFEQNLPGK